MSSSQKMLQNIRSGLRNLQGRFLGFRTRTTGPESPDPHLQQIPYTLLLEDYPVCVSDVPRQLFSTEPATIEYCKDRVIGIISLEVVKVPIRKTKTQEVAIWFSAIFCIGSSVSDFCVMEDDTTASIM